VAVVGGVYDIFTGSVLWLGEHPNLPDIVEHPMPLFTWKFTPYRRVVMATNQISPGAANAIARLKRGNQRFLRGEYHPISSGEIPDPFAIVIGGAEVRVPIEKIFDVGPGDLVVQRCMGSIAGRPGATLFDSIEYAVVRFAPRLLLVMGESDSEVIQGALSQVCMHPHHGATPAPVVMHAPSPRCYTSACCDACTLTTVLHQRLL
jgi:hypothetical protein